MTMFIRQEPDNAALHAGKDVGRVLVIQKDGDREVIKYRKRYRSFATMRKAFDGAHQAMEAAQ